MNIKKLFGTILTILGIGGLIYTAILFVNGVAGSHDTKALAMFSILGIIFFVAGIGLVRTTNDVVE